MTVVRGVGWGRRDVTDWQCVASPRSYFDGLSTSGPTSGQAVEAGAVVPEDLSKAVVGEIEGE